MYSYWYVLNSEVLLLCTYKTGNLLSSILGLAYHVIRVWNSISMFPDIEGNNGWHCTVKDGILFRDNSIVMRHRESHPLKTYSLHGSQRTFFGSGSIRHETTERDVMEILAHRPTSTYALCRHPGFWFPRSLRMAVIFNAYHCNLDTQTVLVKSVLFINMWGPAEVIYC